MRPTGQPFKCALLATLALAVPSTAHASVVFNGLNFGVAGTECTKSCSSTQNGAPYQPNIADWSAMQDDLATNTGNNYKVITSPVRAPGRESAEIHLVPQPAGTSDRIQFRRYSLGSPGVTGKEWWFANSFYFRPGVKYPQWISMMDVGTGYNTSCSNPVSSVGASVPELYFHNNAPIPVDPATNKLTGIPASSPTWDLYVKVAGGTGPGGTKFPCNVQFFKIRTGAIPEGAHMDVLWRFKYSPVNGQAITEFFYRFSPQTIWTQADLNTDEPNAATSLTDSLANLVRTDTSDATIDFHNGDYAEDQGKVQWDTGLNLEGAIVATTRQEAEDAAFAATAAPTCDQACEDAYKSQIADLKQQLADMTASRDAYKARAEKAEDKIARIVAIGNEP